MKVHIVLSAALIILVHSYQSALAQESGGRGCPIISVSHPESNSTARTLTYKANVQNGDPSVTATFKWTVYGGKITSGQGTPEVLVDAEDNHSITITVEVFGYAANCQNKASYSFISEPRRESRKFDEYSNLKFADERLRLNQFATALHNEPQSTGYIIVYDGTDTRKTQARQRGERARVYLVKQLGFPVARIIVVNGGKRNKGSVELFITPAGAVPPTATPTFSPK